MLKGVECQSKSDKGFTYEVRGAQRLSGEAVDLKSFNQKVVSSQYSPLQQDDMAKLVVDVEFGYDKTESIIGLGQVGTGMGHNGQWQNQILAQEEEGIRERIHAGCGSTCEEINSNTNQLNPKVVRELEQSHEEGNMLKGLEDGGGAGDSERHSPPGRCRTKGLWEVGEPSTHPQRSARISARSNQVRNASFLKAGTFSASISDGDIAKCNSQFRDPEIRVESVKLWDLGKQLGIACRGVDEEVVQEMQSMELRDEEFIQRFEEGVKKGYLC